MTYDPTTKPLEMTDPKLAAQIQLIAEGKHPDIARIAVEMDRVRLYMRDGTVKTRKVALPGRNEPCYCGSKVKFKKCCGR